jgi:hypothetical protein
MTGRIASSPKDFADLRVAGYLLMPVPSELAGTGNGTAGGLPRTARVGLPCACQHPRFDLYWMGVAADLRRAGDSSLDWMLRQGAAGEVAAARHAETAMTSRFCCPPPVEGGYRFGGRKHLGSLTPVRTRFGIHASDATDPANPKVVDEQPRWGRCYSKIPVVPGSATRIRTSAGSAQAASSATLVGHTTLPSHRHRRYRRNLLM